jgi:hypothetical protein
MTLEQWLDKNCAQLEKAVQWVPSGRDLPDLYIYGKGESAGFVTLPDNLSDKDLVITLFKSALKKLDADKYAIIMAAWYVQMEPDEDDEIAMQEGTGGRYKDRRKDCYIVAVGDESRSLLATFDVQRDYKKKITGLIRHDADISGLEGRYINLLVPKPTIH